MGGKNTDPQELIASYGLDATVAVGEGVVMTLGQALEAEKLFCPASETSRQDPARRLGYLASILQAGESLLPEHAHLLARPE